MSRRGTIKQDDGGAWGFVVDVAPLGAPRRQVRRRGFRTRREAQAELTTVLHAMGEGSFVAPDRIVVGEWLERWLATLVVAGHRPSTIDSYRRNLGLHVLPHVGAGRLQALTAVDLDRLYARLLEGGRRDGKGGLSARTVRYIHTIIGKALGDAERKGLVVRNVARAATPPSAKAAKAPEMSFWVPEELRSFLAFVEGDELFALWRLLAMSGMRRGEICGLLWRDLDLEGSRATVRRQIITIRRRPLAQEVPKSDHGRRVVDLDPETISVLRSHRARQAERRLAIGPGYRDQDHVFADLEGDPLHPDRISEAFDRRVARSGLPRIRLHDLRHSHCAHLIAAAVNPKAVSKRLGHASVSFTLDRYGHLLPEDDAKAARAVAALVDGR